MAITADALMGLQSSTGEHKRVKLGSSLVISGGFLDTVADALTAVINGEAGSIAKGDAVYQFTTNDTVKLGDADALATSNIIGLVADTTIATTATGNIAVGGLLGGAGSFTAGNKIFLSLTGTTGNTLTATAPTTDGQVQTRLGFAKNATDLHIQIFQPLEL